MDELKPAVEAVLFASPRPVTISHLRETFPEASEEAIRQALDDLRADYQGRAFELLEVAGGYQVMTRPQYAQAVARHHRARSERRLTPATLDTLAILAYRQPITRAEIEAIRGAASGDILRALMEAGLVRTAGRADAPGSPLLYATTPKFLETFGLASLRDLPKPEEMK